MNALIQTMLQKYALDSQDSREKALREIFQEIALLGLWRGKFFEHAAFYGGTALRILYGLDRFSEDMDFSLLHPDPQFTLEKYGQFIEDEISAFGFSAKFSIKEKNKNSQIESAFLKANTAEQLLQIGLIENDQRINIKIKIEVDKDPPLQFKTEVKTLLLPIPFNVKVFVPAVLFAGKLHALLFRAWKNRVKGRDWYDFVWYVARNIPVDLIHLEERMRQSGNWSGVARLTKTDLINLLQQKISALDIDQARDDIARFLINQNSIALWSKDFFYELIDKLKFIEN